MSGALDRVRERRRLVESGASTDELDAFDNAPYETSDRATASDRRQLRSRARQQEQPTHDAYRAGRREGRATSRRRRSPASRRVARQVTAPARSQLRNGFQLLGMTLGLVLLYQLLLTVEAAPGVFQDVLAVPSKALRWLASPTHTILPDH